VAAVQEAEGQTCVIEGGAACGGGAAGAGGSGGPPPDPEQIKKTFDQMGKRGKAGDEDQDAIDKATGVKRARSLPQDFGEAPQYWQMGGPETADFPAPESAARSAKNAARLAAGKAGAPMADAWDGLSLHNSFVTEHGTKLYWHNPGEAPAGFPWSGKKLLGIYF
jgi:hypothetical protein